MKRKIDIRTSVLVILAIITVSIGFSLLTQQLDIEGQANVAGVGWRIHFANLDTVNLTGTSEEIEAPELTVNNTVISGFHILLKESGDKASYMFDVVNDGGIDGIIETLVNSTPTCTGSGVNATNDENTVCSGLTYELKYTSSGEVVKIGDTLDKGETVNVTLTVGYTAVTPIVEDVEVTGLSYYVTYVQRTSGAGDSGGGAEYATGEIPIDIEEGMIAVKFDGTAWVKADEENTGGDWYDYATGKWANIVLVTDGSRAGYISGAVDTIINEADILAYYVWIPRYRYKLWNASNTNVGSNEQMIEVELETVEDDPSCGGYTLVDNECTGANTMNGHYGVSSRVYDSGTNDTWLTHPAFRFGETEINGFWVGKFETSADPTSACYTTPSAVNCDVTNITPRIKPNVDSWRYQTVSKQFEIAKIFKSNTMYGISTSTLDSHMMKNMEWGAVAYLSQSKYGKQGNSNYVGADKEIYINNYRLASPYQTMTGCSSGTTNAGVATTCAHTFPSTSLAATGASSSGTIYGIYDMSGGAYEYVMGNMVDGSGNFYPSSGGTFSPNPPLGKYYDKYNYDASSNTTHNRGHIGDATKETLKTYGINAGGWYGDYSFFPFSSASWFIRGGLATAGVLAGSFYFYLNSGSTHSNYSVRSVLAAE